MHGYLDASLGTWTRSSEQVKPAQLIHADVRLHWADQSNYCISNQQHSQSLPQVYRSTCKVIELTLELRNKWQFSGLPGVHPHRTADSTCWMLEPLWDLRCTEHQRRQMVQWQWLYDLNPFLDKVCKFPCVDGPKTPAQHLCWKWL